MENNVIRGIIKPYFQDVQTYLTVWIVRRPRLALALVILLSVIVLPLITSAALTPFIVFLDFTSFLSAKGTVYVVYTVLVQGFAFTIILVILFFTVFSFVTVASLLHSYSCFYK